jgi:hypothetical protein
VARRQVFMNLGDVVQNIQTLYKEKRAGEKI